MVSATDTTYNLDKLGPTSTGKLLAPCNLLSLVGANAQGNGPSHWLRHDTEPTGTKWESLVFPTTNRATRANVTAAEPGHDDSGISRLQQPLPSSSSLVASVESSTSFADARGDNDDHAGCLNRQTRTVATTTNHLEPEAPATNATPSCNSVRGELGNSTASAPFSTTLTKSNTPNRGRKITFSHPKPLPRAALIQNGSWLGAAKVSGNCKRSGSCKSTKVNKSEVNAARNLFRQTLILSAAALILLLVIDCSHLIARADSLDPTSGASSNRIDQTNIDSNNNNKVEILNIPNSDLKQAQSSLSSEPERLTTPTTTTPATTGNKGFEFFTKLITSLKSRTTKVLAQATTPISQPSASQIVTATPLPATTTTTQITTTTTTSDQQDSATTTRGDAEDQDERPSSEDDDDDAESCKGISAHEPAKGKNLSDSERLVHLQSCIQRKIRRHLLAATRSGLELFDKLSLSGACASSLMSLMSNLAGIKSFAFKFLDASAKIPSGVMYGLLSDFGDFDQCLSARSDPSVPLELEDEEGAYSGKYCLMSVKLNYHVDLEANKTVPDGIIEDGVFWDDLVRNYWTSKSPKGFQLGMCFPSRCTNDDLDQLYRYVAESYNVVGEIISCQDGLDIKRQYEPDIVQRIIIVALFVLILVTLFGSIVDRYYPELASDQPTSSISSSSSAFAPPTSERKVSSYSGSVTMTFKILICFSIAKNWRTFMRKDNDIRPTIRLASGSASCRTSSTYETDICDLNKTGSKSISSSSGSSGSNGSNGTLAPQMETNLEMGDEVNQAKPDQIIEVVAVETPTIINNSKICQLTVKIQPDDSSRRNQHDKGINLSHLSGLRLIVIFWITIGHSFLYPSASNYQHYRSIINMNITRDSVWFATTNFTLGIDMLLYITGLLFVYKLAQLGPKCHQHRSPVAGHQVELDLNRHDSMWGTLEPNGYGILRLISKKILRLWPTYVTVIAFAIVVPLLSDGPMWPEMVSKRLGASCRQNWWSNLLFINNFLTESEICLPSSWFVSVLMQLFLIGSVIVVLERKYSISVAMLSLCLMLALSCAFSFLFAYFLNLRAPVIRMDETFVLDVDENIWRLYINIFNNLGPFLVGMAGGYLLLKTQTKHFNGSSSKPSSSNKTQSSERKKLLIDILIGLCVLTLAVLVLSSVFHQEYSKLWSSIYWSFHRIGWAIVTGYIIHNCATGKWKLLNDLLSLSTLIPLSRLVFIAYLVYPIYIHVHSGLVRDGLHVSIYNMFNIYTTRLVLTFITALMIHLLVELPFCSIEEIYLNRWVSRIETKCRRKDSSSKFHPLLAVAPIVSLHIDDGIKNQTNEPTNTK